MLMRLEIADTNMMELLHIATLAPLPPRSSLLLLGRRCCCYKGAMGPWPVWWQSRSVGQVNKEATSTWCLPGSGLSTSVGFAAARNFHGHMCGLSTTVEFSAHGHVAFHLRFHVWLHVLDVIVYVLFLIHRLFFLIDR